MNKTIILLNIKQLQECPGNLISPHKKLIIFLCNTGQEQMLSCFVLENSAGFNELYKSRLLYHTLHSYLITDVQV